ncbi:MAG TPA: flagellar basal-body rod protein FlgF [Candidatus Aminicenantes bacterium]|nr:flagellar basal-body rod protein FlgF [Candidatus Aminicenantes bacterium]
MWSGYYTAASGMVSTLTQLDVVTNNLANMTTPGFKKDVAHFQTANYRTEPETPGEENLFRRILNSQSTLAGTKTDFSPGPMVTTGRNLDLAIQGEGFFTVRTPQGERYTRQGALQINEKGELVSASGAQLLDKNNAPVTIPGNTVHFTENGDVFSDGVYVTALKVVKFDKPEGLSKEGTGLYTAAQGTKETILETPQVRSGTLEKSNVSIEEAMGDLIRIQRTFEFQERVMTTLLNDVARKTTEEVGRPT